MSTDSDVKLFSAKKSSRFWIVIGVLVAFVGAAVAWWFYVPPKVDVVEFAMVSPKDIPAVIAIGPDGSVWFTIDFAAAVGRVNNGKV